MSAETREIRIKRLHMRACRRGIKEMDLVLGRYATDHLAEMDDAELDHFEALLAEMDQDMLRWITGVEPVPERFAALFGRIEAHAKSHGTAH